MQSLNDLSQLFKALSEPVRLRIVNLLLQRDSLCVCDLVEVLQVGQSTVSRHLAYLKNAGMVTSYREGTWMNYKIIPEAFKTIHTKQLHHYFKTYPEIQQDQHTLAKYEKQPRNCSINP